MALLCRLLAQLSRDTRGNVLPIVGAALVPLTIMIGSGVDLSRAYMAKSKMQSACDAASLAARRVKKDDALSSEVEATGKDFFGFNFAFPFNSGAMRTGSAARPLGTAASFRGRPLPRGLGSGSGSVFLPRGAVAFFGGALKMAYMSIAALEMLCFDVCNILLGFFAFTGIRGLSPGRRSYGSFDAGWCSPPALQAP